MKVTYQLELDDPAAARTRTFARAAGPWPFPTLPAPGDAVTIRHTAGDRWTPTWPIQSRAVHRVVYDPREGVATIVFRVTGLEDAQPQVDVLTEGGFVEVTPDHPM